MESKFVVFALLLLLSHRSSQQLYSPSDIERKLDALRRLSTSLSEYIEAEEVRLTRLWMIQEKYLKIQAIAEENVKAFLDNPVDTLLLVKSLTSDWKSVESLTVADPSEVQRKALIDVAFSLNDSIPTAQDLDDTRNYLLRLQDIYLLEPSSLARRILSSNHSSTEGKEIEQLELSAGDCFGLGKIAYSKGDHNYTVKWMREALERVLTEDAPTVELRDVLEHLSFSTYKLGNVAKALELTNDLLKIAPNHKYAVGNKIFFEDYLRREAQGRLTKEETSSETRPETSHQTYQALCRGDRRRAPEAESKLFCYYERNAFSSFLKLALIKVELVSKDPLLVLYHDVLSDSEIATLMNISSPLLRRATVKEYDTGRIHTSSYRVAENAWLEDDDHEVVKRVGQRIEDIVGLSVKTAETLQICSYGIGGHYEPHHDHSQREEKSFRELTTGNRIATWMYYLNDVVAGGATVFPRLGVTLWPRKGSAAFWYNLRKSGEGEELSEHAGCPVLAGTKVVANKWFHELEQEFRRPCGLSSVD